MRNTPLALKLVASLSGTSITNPELSKAQNGAPLLVFVGFLNILMSPHLSGAAIGLPKPVPGEPPKPATRVPSTQLLVATEPVPRLNPPSMLPWPVAPATIHGS